MMVFLPIPMLISLLVVGVVFVFLGLLRGVRLYVGVGATVTGLSLLLIIMAFVLHDASTVSSSEPFNPSGAYLISIATLIFLSGTITALGLYKLATRNRQ